MAGDAERDGHGTSSEFVRELIRREQARVHVRTLVLDGMASGPGSTADADYFSRLTSAVEAAVTLIAEVPSSRSPQPGTDVALHTSRDIPAELGDLVGES